MYVWRAVFMWFKCWDTGAACQDPLITADAMSCAKKPAMASEGCDMCIGVQDPSTHIYIYISLLWRVLVMWFMCWDLSAAPQDPWIHCRCHVQSPQSSHGCITKYLYLCYIDFRRYNQMIQMHRSSKVVTTQNNFHIEALKDWAKRIKKSFLLF